MKKKETSEGIDWGVELLKIPRGLSTLITMVIPPLLISVALFGVFVLAVILPIWVKLTFTGLYLLWRIGDHKTKERKK